MDDVSSLPRMRLVLRDYGPRLEISGQVIEPLRGRAIGQLPVTAASYETNINGLSKLKLEAYIGVVEIGT